MFWFPSPADAKQDANERTTQEETERKNALNIFTPTSGRCQSIFVDGNFSIRTSRVESSVEPTFSVELAEEK